MAKITLNDLVNLQNESSAVASINANNSAIETAMENTLSRDGTSPNSMGASLDMNSNRILNLPFPLNDNEPARKIDLDNAILGDYAFVRYDVSQTLTEDEKTQARANIGAEGRDSTLDALAGVASAADKLPYFTGVDAASVTDLSAFGRTLIDDASASAARTTLGVVIGTDVQAQDAELSAIAGLVSAANKLPYFTGSGTASLADFSAYGRTLVDDADAATARATLGLVINTDVQAYDSDLAAVAALATTGLISRTGSGTAATRTLTGPAAGISVSNGDGVSGNPTLSLTNDLSAVEGLASNGLAVRTATDTWTTRTLTAPAAGITVSNGDGVSGNPTLALANDLLALEGIATTNVIPYRSATDTWGTVTIGTGLGLTTGTLAITDAELTALAGLTSAADKVPYFTGSGTAALADFSSFGRSLVDDADAATARSTLGLVIGTNVQAYDAELAALAGTTSAADKVPYFTGAGTATTTDLTSTARSLLDDTSTSAMRTTLGLGSSAVKDTGTSGNTVPLLDGANTWSGVQGYGETALTWTSGGTTSWDVSAAPCATVTASSGNTTFGAPTNVVAGRFYHLRFVQDSTARTISWNAAYHFTGGSAPTLSTGSGAVDHFVFYGRASNVLEEIGRSQGVA